LSVQNKSEDEPWIEVKPHSTRNLPFRKSRYLKR